MEEKVFQAQSMLEVLEKVQTEMGPDAVVVSVREIQSPSWSLKKKTIFEIKAAPAGTEVKPKAAAPKEKQAQPASPSQPPPAPVKSPAPKAPVLVDDVSTIEWLTDELQTVPPAKKQATPAAPAAPAAPARTEIEQQVTSPAPRPSLPVPAPRAGMPANLRKIQSSLAAQDVAPDFLDRIFELACEALPPQTLNNDELVKTYLSRQMQAELRVSPSYDLKPPAPVICLVGTSGSGKTSMAARLAMHYGVQHHKRVVWICADVVRTSAIVEARTYTDALGVPMVVVYTPADLKMVLSDTRGSDLVIIDLPGYNPLDEAQVAELGTFLTEVPRRCLLLVASASQKEKDLFQAAASFGIFGLNGLAVTKMDETLTFGSIFNLAQKSQIPLVYFSAGRGTAGSFQSASAERLVSALFSHGDF